MSDLFLRACRGEAVPRPPVWIMRQAGRYLPEYRAVRARADFLTLCKTPELVVEVTLQPIDIVGVDAAILFADILLPLAAMGAELAFHEGRGPVFARPVRHRDHIDDLIVPDVEQHLGYVFEAVRQVRSALNGRVPLIGFAGTPWTQASYLIEGGTSRSFAHLLGWSYSDPQGLDLLLQRITATTIDYLHGQVAAGVQALQLFDTWGGLLDRARWRRLARPHIETILDAVGGTVPLIYYIRGGAHLLEELADLPIDVLSVDWRLPLDAVRRQVGPRLVLQGNLDPGALLGPTAAIDDHVRTLLAAGAGGGHIVNLGHGILPMTPVANAQRFVAAVHAAVAEPA